MSNVADMIDEDGNITDEGTVIFLNKCISEFKPYAEAINGMVAKKEAAKD